MQPVGPILTSELFPEVRGQLLLLLESLSEEEWLAPTAAGKWNVKDVALHLLGGDLGNLSRRRDQYSLPASIASWGDLVEFINGINASWVEASQRLSTRVLRDLLEHSGRQMEEYFMSLDPLALGTPVNWAGPERAPNWLDVAREYTERWHHQQQIRDATGRAGLYEARLFGPVLDTFVRGLPHTFREVEAATGTMVRLRITGEAGGVWTLRRAAGAWELLAGEGAAATAEVTVAGEVAWKIFTRGVRGEQARAAAKMAGDAALGGKVLEMVSVIA
jgi:uncharacterized protein (TIGR03083 family)